MSPIDDSEFGSQDETDSTRSRADETWLDGGAPGIAGELRPGSSIGPYTLESVLGEGGFGTVFLAEQGAPVRRKVAIKVIKPGMDSRQVLARFEAERQALAFLAHPSIARIYESGTTGPGRPYFVMEYAAGDRITDHCDARRATIRERLELFVKVCAAVQHAHQRGIIHRDLKPSNVLVADVDGEATPKIIDFGIAKAMDERLVEDADAFTQIGQLIGTPAYMSPEQARGALGDIDTRTDIYSLGVILYELLSGGLPLDRETLASAGPLGFQSVLLEKDPPLPSQRAGRSARPAKLAEARSTTAPRLVRELEGDLDWVVMKALSKDRTERYASASELASDVERFLDFEPVLAAPPSTTYIIKKFVRKNRRVLVSSCAVLLFLLVSVWTVLFLEEADQLAETLASATRYLDQASELEQRWNERRSGFEARREAWSEARRENPTWLPVWRRQRELEAWQELSLLELEVDSLDSRIESALENAKEFAPDGTDVDLAAVRALEDFLFRKYEFAELSGGVAFRPEHFRQRIEALSLGTYEKFFEGRGRAIVRSEPAGANVYCFRFEIFEQRLLPLPFSPGMGNVGAPRLVVERNWTGVSPFVEGDQLVRVNGVPLASRGELARLLDGRELGSAVSVEVMRAGGPARFDWVPFPQEPDPADLPAEFFGAREVVDFYLQLGITFAGAPLDCVEDCRIGETSETAPLEVTLPRGSYLLVFRKQGHVDLRLPIVIPSRGEKSPVRLRPESEIPDGFVLVPAGPVAYGGDDRAFQSLERGERSLDDFFISKFETTTRQYLEFVNDPEIFALTGPGGEYPFLERSPDETDADYLARFLELRKRVLGTHAHATLPARLGENQHIHLIPRQSSLAPYWTREETRWVTSARWTGERPVLDMPQLAAVEYARWKTRRSGGEWRYRLPDDLEWEKAARGLDRRIYPWGNYLVWSFCWALNSFPHRPPPDRVGTRPIDESVYGVRDLAGSVDEHTSGMPVDGHGYTSLRGCNWRVPDDFYARIATRNGRLPWSSKLDTGFRLVAVRPDSSRDAGER